MALALGIGELRFWVRGARSVLRRGTPSPTLGGAPRARKGCHSCVIFNSRDRSIPPGCPVPWGQCSRQKSHPAVKRVHLVGASFVQPFSSTTPRVAPRGAQEVEDPRHSAHFLPIRTTSSVLAPPPKSFLYGCPSWTGTW